MKSGLVKDNSQKVFKALIDIAKLKAYVGIPAENAAREDSKINNPTIGYIMEFGSAAQNIPARPFLVPAIKDALPEIEKILASGMRSALEFRSNGEAALEKAGLFSAATVKKYIRAGGKDWPPLAEGTLKAREREGAKGTSPLIRTGSLLGSINYVVK